MALDGAGNGVAVWLGQTGSGAVSQAAERPNGGVWSAPIDVSVPVRASVWVLGVERDA